MRLERAGLIRVNARTGGMAECCVQILDDDDDDDDDGYGDESRNGNADASISACNSRLC